MNDLHSDLDPGILFLLHVFALCIIALGISRYCKANDFSDELILILCSSLNKTYSLVEVCML